MSEVRGRSQEDPMPEGRRPRGVTLRPRSGAAAGRSYPTPEAKGSSQVEKPHARGQGRRWEEPPHAQGQGRQPGGATPHPRPGTAARWSNPMSKEWWLCGRRRA